MTAPTASSLLAERYGRDDAPADAVAPNAIIAALLGHRSVRAYARDPLPAGTLSTLIAAAQSAPTSSNLQAWSVVAVEDPDRRDRLATLAANQDFIRQAPLFLCWVADLSRLERLGQANDKRLEGLDYLECFMVALADACFAAQNALVAAESLGLGTCYVGALRNRPDAVAAELRLPPNAMAVFGLTVGRPAPDVATAIKPRLPQALVLHRETYTPEAAEDVVRYDDTLAAFSERVGLGRTAWTPRMLTRVGSAAGLSGRDRMRTVLGALGFGLK